MGFPTRLVNVSGMAWPRRCFHFWLDSFSDLRWRLIYYLISIGEVGFPQFQLSLKIMIFKDDILDWNTMWNKEKLSGMIRKYLNCFFEMWFEPPTVLFFPEGFKACPCVDVEASRTSVREVTGAIMCVLCVCFPKSEEREISTVDRLVSLKVKC